MYDTYGFKFIRFGGFPEVVVAENDDHKKDLISDILSSYLNYDIAILADIRKSADLYKLVKLLLNRIGTRLDISKLTSFTQLSRPTVENYLELLEQSYLIKTIPDLAQKIGVSESYVVGRHPGQVFDGLVWGGLLAQIPCPLPEFFLKNVPGNRPYSFLLRNT